ncbi:MAG: hypothetical protein QXI22_09270 [Sulfolobales archaeon]
MDLVHIGAVVKHMGKSISVKLLVDSGITYTVPKKNVREYLGLEPLGEAELVLADGSIIKRKVSEVLIELNGYGE